MDDTLQLILSKNLVGGSIDGWQPRSQGLSPLPPLSLGKETLVAAGHVNTQNLGDKKICWTGGVAECFDCCCGKLCGFQNLEQPLKTTRFIRVSCGSLPMKKCYIISAVSKI